MPKAKNIYATLVDKNKLLMGLPPRPESVL